MILPPQKGRILISEPFLQDPNFHRTVVLLTEHGEEGSIGFVLNQSTNFEVAALIPDLDSVNEPLLQGGPVERDSLHFLHTYPDIPEAVDLGNGIWWSGDFKEVTVGLLSGRLKPERFKFFVGYSGWGQGQLQDELDDEVWIVGEFEADQLFGVQLDDELLWREAMRKLGGNYALLANSPHNPHLN